MKNLFRQLPLWLLSTSLLTGCATVTEEGQDFHNKKYYGIDCSGAAISINVCYEKAAKLCPAGYTVIANEAASITDNMLSSPLTPGALLGNSIPGVKKGIRVTCK